MDFGITERAFVKNLCNMDVALKPENEINGLYFSSFVSGQYDVYKNCNNVGYVHLSCGELNAFFPNLYGKIIFHHDFKNIDKRKFSDEAEKQKFLSLIADRIEECLKEYEVAHFSKEENILWEYYASITGEKMADIREKKIKHFPLFMWVFGCENTVKALGLKKVKEYFKTQAFSYKAGESLIEHEDIMGYIPSLNIKEDYAWLKKLICEHPRSSEEKILKLYHCPIDINQEFENRFPKHLALPVFGAGSDLISFKTNTQYGTMSFKVGINEKDSEGDVIVYLNGKETENQQLKKAVLKGLNRYHEDNWVCIASFTLRTLAYDFKITLDEKTEKPVISGPINDECLSVIARGINEITEECAWWDWED